MRFSVHVLRVVSLMGCLAAVPSVAHAQTGAIAGQVTDTTAAVLPGVTVEAASPALIEKVRTVVSDGEGQYKIVSLSPGTYTVTSVIVISAGMGVTISGPGVTILNAANTANGTLTFNGSGRLQINAAFDAEGLTPNVVLTALDSDVIKSYVTLGLGVGIISSRAFRKASDEGLRALDCDHLFPAQTTRLAYKRGAYLRGYTIEFIRLIAPHVRGTDLKQLESAAGETFSI
jgi:hypothetical protein